MYQNQEAFLSNNEKKEQFVGLLTKYLQEENHTAINCLEDVDNKIMLQAIEITNGQKTIKVIPDDTHVFVLLMYHINME